MRTSINDRINKFIWDVFGFKTWMAVYGHPCSRKNCEYHDVCKAGNCNCYRQELEKPATYKIIRFYDIPGGDCEGTCIEYGLYTREEALARAAELDEYSPEEVRHSVHVEDLSASHSTTGECVEYGIPTKEEAQVGGLFRSPTIATESTPECEVVGYIKHGQQGREEPSSIDMIDISLDDVDLTI